jgi:DEAD/DEAH box helicase domain-containing protein
MRSRFDMQVAPPDIIITNYSMLSIMFMRDIDKGILMRLKQWLACEDLSEREATNRILILIIDELHLYRGTQGTEVAYLLKLVLNRLGLHPHHPQLRILASSASLEAGDEATVKILCVIFSE